MQYKNVNWIHNGLHDIYHFFSRYFEFLSLFFFFFPWYLRIWEVTVVNKGFSWMLIHLNLNFWENYLKCEEVRRRRKCHNHGPSIKYVHFTSLQINPKSGSPSSCAESHLMGHIHLTEKNEHKEENKRLKKKKEGGRAIPLFKYKSYTNSTHP